jgi:hypothetical protein
MPSTKMSSTNSSNSTKSQITSKPQIRFMEEKPPAKKINVRKALKTAPTMGYFVPTNTTGILPQVKPYSPKISNPPKKPRSTNKKKNQEVVKTKSGRVVTTKI